MHHNLKKKCWRNGFFCLLHNLLSSKYITYIIIYQALLRKNTFTTNNIGTTRHKQLENRKQQKVI